MTGRDVRIGSDGHTLTRPRAASWSRSGVIKAILQRESDGLPLNSSAVARQHAALYHAAIRRFEGWNGALRAAGIVRKTPVLRGKSDVLKAILQRESDGLPLNRVAVLKDDSCLHNDILRLFGSWDAAMCASGIDPASVRRHRRWTRQSVIHRIRELADEGQPLNAAAVQRAEATLPSAASRYFSSWNEALEAAGVDPARWRKRVPTWTRERVIRAIQQIHAKGGKVNHAALGRNSISRAGVMLFGSWDTALRAAGLNPDDIRVYRKPWTPEEVILEIQRKHRQGEPLNAKDVSPHSLRSRGTVFFGSWDAALTTAGLDPSKIRKKNSGR